MSKGKSPHLILGGIHVDERGNMRFCNDFDMSQVKRMYLTTPSMTSNVRAWQGHRVEQKWFYCNKGSFEVHLRKPHNWDTPSRDLMPLIYKLSETESHILHIPGGYINGFKSLEDESELLIFSDQELDSSKKDDFRYEVDYWPL